MKDKLLRIISNEFKQLLNKFEIFEIDFTVEFAKIKDEDINTAGCYVIAIENEALKVGRHFINSKKRAFDHFRDNTGGINSLNKNEIKIYLVNVKDLKDDFWIASLEILLERELNPKIKSKRKG